MTQIVPLKTRITTMNKYMEDFYLTDYQTQKNVQLFIYPVMKIKTKMYGIIIL